MDAPITTIKPIFPAPRLKAILNRKEIHFNSIVYWDLDNTIFQTKKELGSDEWISHLITIAKSKLGTAFETQLIKALYNAVQHFIEIMPVERDTLKIIAFLNHIGVTQRLITARSPALKTLTLKQLTDLDPSMRTWLRSKDIIFCDAQHRGRALFKSHLFSNNDHIIMIDDKYQNVEAVQAIAQRLHLNFTGFHYTYLTDTVAAFDMHQANFQLLLIKHLLPLHIQDFINRLELTYEVQPQLYLKEKSSEDAQSSPKRP